MLGYMMKPVQKPEKLVIGSGNPAKVDFYRSLFIDVSGEVVGLKQLGVMEKPQESGETAEENATIKGRD